MDERREGEAAELLRGGQGWSSARPMAHMYASGSGRPTPPSCTAKAVSGFVNGAVFGATMSGLSAMARATQLEIGFPMAVRVTVGATLAGGLSFGTGLGIYRGVVCSLEKARGVEDIKNSMIAGGIVGALSEIPVLIRSRLITRADVMLAEQGVPVMRPRPRFFTTAAAGSIICGVVYMVEAAMRPSPAPAPQEDPPAAAPHAARTYDDREGAGDLDVWSSSAYRQEGGGEWALADPPPSAEVLETEELGWGTK